MCISAVRPGPVFTQITFQFASSLASFGLFGGKGSLKMVPYISKLNTNPISSLLKQNSNKKSGAAQNLLSFNQSQRSSTI